ncbi:MAG: hypothetical protein GPOALKHO_000954 [Sodalis sp.]|nr:MAG: hypothetical protein GPOALKHO_000954 [Sodalis sp.]
MAVDNAQPVISFTRAGWGVSRAAAGVKLKLKPAFTKSYAARLAAVARYHPLHAANTLKRTVLLTIINNRPALLGPMPFGPSTNSSRSRY